MATAAVAGDSVAGDSVALDTRRAGGAAITFSSNGFSTSAAEGNLGAGGAAQSRPAGRRFPTAINGAVAAGRADVTITHLHCGGILPVGLDAAHASLFSGRTYAASAGRS